MLKKPLEDPLAQSQVTEAPKPVSPLGPQPGMRPGALPPMGYGNPVQAPGQQTVRPGGSQSFARRSPDLVPAQGVPVQQPGALEGPQRQFVQGSKLRPRGTSPVDPMQQPAQPQPGSVVATPDGPRWQGAMGSQMQTAQHPISGEAMPVSDGLEPVDFAANLTPDARATLVTVARDSNSISGREVTRLEKVREAIMSAPNMDRRTKQAQLRAVDEQQAQHLHNLADSRTLGPALRQIGQDHQRETADMKQQSHDLFVEQTKQAEKQRAEVKAATEKARADLERQYGPYREVTDNEAQSLAMQRLAAQGTVPIDEAAAQQPQNAAAAQTDGDVPLGNGDPNDYQQTPNGLFMVDPSTGQMKQADVVHGVAAVRVESMAEEQALPPGTHFYRPGEKSREVHIAKPQAGASGDGAATGQQDAKVEFAAQEAAQSKVNDTIGKEHAAWRKEAESYGAFEQRVMAPMEKALLADMPAGSKVVNGTVFGKDGIIDAQATATYATTKQRMMMDALNADKEAQGTAWGKQSIKDGVVSMPKPSKELQSRMDLHQSEQDRMKGSADEQARTATDEQARGAGAAALKFIDRVRADPYQRNVPADEAMKVRESIMASITAAKKSGGERFAGTHGDPKRALGAAQAVADYAVDPTIIPGSVLAMPTDKEADYFKDAVKIVDAVGAAAEKAGIREALAPVVQPLRAGKTLKGDSPEMASARRAVLKSNDPAMVKAWRALTTKDTISTVPERGLDQYMKALGNTGVELAQGSYKPAEFDPAAVRPEDVAAATSEAYAKKGTTQGAEDEKKMAKAVAALPRFADGTVSLPGGARVRTVKVGSTRWPVADSAEQALQIVKSGLPQMSGSGPFVAAQEAQAVEPSVPAMGAYVKARFAHLPQEEQDALIKGLVRSFKR